MDFYLPEPAIETLIQILADRYDYQTLSAFGRLDHRTRELVQPLLTRLEAEPMAIDVAYSQCWYKDGKLHRDHDLPAMIFPDGMLYWYQHGQHHRDNDRPAKIYYNGTKMWYCHGKIHRDNDRPAVITWDGNLGWVRNGMRHRDNDRPALILADGSVMYWRNGVQYNPSNAH